MFRWTYTYDDLDSLGIKVSPEQQQMLEKGGEVLALERFPTVETQVFGDTATYALKDICGDHAVLPMVFETNPPQGHIGEELEMEHGKQWRRYPSYTGIRRTFCLDSWHDDMLLPVRVWQGVPLLTTGDHAVAAEIITAANQQLVDCRYQDLCELESMEDEASRSNCLDSPNEYSQDYWALRHSLHKSGLIKNVPTEGDPDQYFAMRDPDITPLDAYLTLKAAAMWGRLVRQSKRGSNCVLYGIATKNRKDFKQEERRYQPWF